MENHWEKERAAWLLAHSKPHTGRRRRAEILKLAAKQQERLHSGASENLMHEDITPNLFHRMMATDDGAGEKLIRMLAVPICFGAAGLSLGPGIALAAGLYYVWWRRTDKFGPLKVLPYLVIGLVIAVLGGFIVAQLGPSFILTPWPLGVEVVATTFWTTYLWLQVASGFILAGLAVREFGWSGVKQESVLKETVTKKSKIKIDPLAGIKIKGSND